MQFDVLDAEANRLGECPIWCERTERLWWVDVLTPALWSHDPATEICLSHPISARRLGSIALRQAGGLLLACENGLFSYDPETGEQAFLIDPEPGRAGHRKNDGRTDPDGNFWIGTLQEDAYSSVGSLYRVTPDRSVSVEATNLAIPNSLAFDPERSRVYYADTRAYTIWYREFAAPDSDRKVFAKTTAPARPDGSCIDAEGHLWNAEYAGGRVVRYAPSGEISMTIDLPVSHPTCCCFGGADFQTLYVTSAIEPLTTDQMTSEPFAGKVLALKVGISGRAEFRTRI
ncbi:SMP-30/gluconolactonase/LRE family protein [Mesorhizobium sp. SB112]|uniref:SMP-30/gluconolactonase/LRE family protein n=1 Tax=Mesorhizobium sp. SB112 TaxID=3151853 RepID=UPI00326361EA